MAQHIRKCPQCSTYTLQLKCKKCSSETWLPRPPKYSPEDKYARFRRMKT